MKKFFGFTLAEVLIAMGIVSVVAAMTMPTLVNNYRKNTYALNIRKIVNEIEQAADIQLTEEEKNELAKTSVFKNEDGLDNFIESRFDVAAYTKGFSDTYKYSGGVANNSSFINCSSNKCYLLSNGAAIQVEKVDDNILFYIDTNGKSAPNSVGQDLFRFFLNNEGTVVDTSNTDCVSKSNAEGCLKKLMDNDWKMDY